MKLSYRGAHYDHQPTPVDMVDSGVSGQYRGQQLRFTYPRHVPVPQPVANLKYRGVAYQTTATGGANPLAQSSGTVAGAHPELSAGERPVSIDLPLAAQVRRLQASELARVHLENIRQRLQHRIEVAKAKGDTRLLHELEREMQRFA